MTKTTLIFGAGFSGRAYGRLLHKRDQCVMGTTRTIDKAERLTGSGIEPLLFSGTLNDALANGLEKTTDLVISIGPDADGDPVLRSLPKLVEHCPKLEWIAYLSTVGVYGNHDGAWVNETTQCKPVSVRSVQRVAAEKAWMDFSSTHGLPLSILRLSGIYGPGRNGLKTLDEGRSRRLVKKGQVFNRIRVEDIASALAFLSERRAAGIWNVTDDMPAPPQDVVGFAAQLMGVEAPPEMDFETADLTPMARSFYGENKRVSNQKIKEAGFHFAYPNYEMSLSQLWQSDQWRSEA